MRVCTDCGMDMDNGDCRCSVHRIALAREKSKMADLREDWLAAEREQTEQRKRACAAEQRAEKAEQERDDYKRRYSDMEDADERAATAIADLKPLEAALGRMMDQRDAARIALREISIGKVRADYEHPMGEWASMAARFLTIARAALKPEKKG